ncbi:MAG TPA: DivIVA domain-containing protein, partial [Actinomycetota bacterium]|nr:DivIVA domain-containing protein [Actinomycetota bacterium]
MTGPFDDPTVDPGPEPVETPDPAQRRRFSTSFRGYSPTEVDAHLAQLESRMAELESQDDYLTSLNEALATEVEGVRTERDSLRQETDRLRSELETIRTAATGAEELRAELEGLRARYAERVKAIEFVLASTVRQVVIDPPVQE